jgi:pantoate--beta-alanine ligase
MVASSAKISRPWGPAFTGAALSCSMKAAISDFAEAAGSPRRFSAGGRARSVDGAVVTGLLGSAVLATSSLLLSFRWHRVPSTQVTEPRPNGADVMADQMSAAGSTLPAPPIDRSVDAIRARVTAWRDAGEGVAMVPTMGALHAGHLALVAAARELAARVIVSIFVNPLQFAPTEDFSAYPRDLEGDVGRLAAAGADVVFAPDGAEMYPAGYATRITVGGPSEGLETAFRPHFFEGVATVVAKLLIACGPEFAVFGEKDYQQLLVVRRMVRDLMLPVEIVGLPTVREADGLALSSRNAYLSAEERNQAPALHRALQEAASALKAGELAGTVLTEAREQLAKAGFDVDYVELRNADTLVVPVHQEREPLRLLAAARLGKTRLIDNIPV